MDEKPTASALCGHAMAGHRTAQTKSTFAALVKSVVTVKPAANCSSRCLRKLSRNRARVGPFGGRVPGRESCISRPAFRLYRNEVLNDTGFRAVGSAKQAMVRALRKEAR